MADSKKNVPQTEELLLNLDRIAFTLDKAYLDYIEDGAVIPFDEDYNKNHKISYSSNIRAVRIGRWVYDKNEKIIDCFKNVLSVFAGSGNSLGTVIRRTPSNVEMFFITQNTGEGNNEVSTNDIKLLEDSLLGNFPGSRVDVIDSGETQNVMDNLLGHDTYKSISCLCNIPSDKSEEYVSQGIDKLLNGIVPKTEQESYSILILGKAWKQDEIHRILTGYHELATAITPFSGYQFQIGENSTESISEMEALAHSEGISNSITKTHSINLGVNASTGLHIGGSIPLGQGGLNMGLSQSSGQSIGYGYSVAKSKTISSNDTWSKGTTRSISVGASSGTAYTYKSYVVCDLISKLELAAKRIQQGQANGLWSSATYVLAQDAKTSKNVAYFLQSLTQGDESFVERSFVQEWSYQNSNGVTPFGEIKKYLQHFSHPVFVFKSNEVDIPVTPTANISTNELAKLFAFPRNSVPGIPVTECAKFGRNVISRYTSIDGNVRLGCIYHMQKKEAAPVNLNAESLTAHTFITGSTGSGKSNTVYTLLKNLCFANEDDTHFLVIEPAKGEYKQVFGGRSGVSVYGTNFKMANLLRLNPFSFPDEIHVLEHIDRLIEIFNACWPMYAAMPAVLKDSIEESYKSCGWSLTHSVCEPKRYPTFETLLKKLPEIMNSSAYSKDTKGDYTGALVTRVKSLTNGINGQIFCSSDELTSEELFDRNVIVDLSRVGSMETKSLLMGILMIKLQEHRMAKADGTNAGLRHVTVLEEAHNLLRRTLSEQSQDSSNLQGKSVEMLANAIAEMRTYGEGFIIADQAPGLLDMAVIRNTNTKIIMRLPDESDRVLVGKAAGLTDDQIVELSKLDRGVAAVFQNHWLEAVLCRVDEFKKDEMQPFSYSNPQVGKSALQAGTPRMNFLFEKLLGKPSATELSDEEVDKIRTWIDGLNVQGKTKMQLRSVLEGAGNLTMDDKRELLYRIVNGNDFLKRAGMYAGTDSARAAGMREIDHSIMEMLQVSALLAEEIRKQVFLFAADRIKEPESQHIELKIYGGVK